MNFKRIFESTHLREEMRRNILVIERFLQKPNGNFGYEDFVKWIKSATSEDFFELNGVDYSAPLYYSTAAAIVDTLNLDPDSFPGLKDGIKREKENNEEQFNNNYEVVLEKAPGLVDESFTKTSAPAIKNLLMPSGTKWGKISYSGSKSSPRSSSKSSTSSKSPKSVNSNVLTVAQHIEHENNEKELLYEIIEKGINDWVERASKEKSPAWVSANLPKLLNSEQFINKRREIFLAERDSGDIDNFLN